MSHIAHLHTAPLRNILTWYTCQLTNPHTQDKYLLFFFNNLVSDFTVTLVCPPWSSFPYKHILARFLSSPTALHSIHILVAPIPNSSILTTLLNSIPGYSTARLKSTLRWLTDISHQTSTQSSHPMLQIASSYRLHLS